MTETIFFSLVFSRFKGYKWSQIFKLIKHWSFYPILMTMVFHIYFIYLMIKGEYWFVQYSNYIKTVSILFYLILIWKYNLFNISVFKNIKVDKKPLLTVITSPVAIGVLCMVTGSILNKIAMIFNDGKMPVFPNVSMSIGYTKVDMFDKMLQFNDWHVLGNFNTHLIFLSDFIDGFVFIASPGDILIRVFIGMIIYYSIKQINKGKIIIDKYLTE